MSPATTQLAIIGAGPVGLEAALAAAERGLPFTVYESAEAPAANIRLWGHVHLFTPWEMIVSPRISGAFQRVGAELPSDALLPTGQDVIRRLFEPVASMPWIASALQLSTRVRAVGREGLLKHEEIASAERARRPFRILVEGPSGERIEHADVVLDCTGAFDRPNSLGDGGIPAPGEKDLGDRIEHRIPDLHTHAASWAGRSILLTGAGHSAQTAARAVASLAERTTGTRIHWAIRSPSPSWGAIEDDPLVERARLAADAAKLAAGSALAVDVHLGWVVEALTERAGQVAVTLRRTGSNGGRQEVVVDRILALNGDIGDSTIYRQLQVRESYATMSPAGLAEFLVPFPGRQQQPSGSGRSPETLLHPEPRFFVVGRKSYGHKGTFLMRRGWEQVDHVFELLSRG